MTAGGAERITRERRRQLDVEGWDATNDDRYRCGELALAAGSYALAAARRIKPPADDYDEPDPWPWDAEWDKRPAWTATTAQRIRALEKAGALCAAEIDRLLRLGPAAP